MKSFLFFLTFIVAVTLSCTHENDPSPEVNTVSYFRDNLKPDMNYNSIVAKFGEPAKDIGSGIHIYVYVLADSTEIWIGYADKIIYARHMDKNHQLIEIII